MEVNISHGPDQDDCKWSRFLESGGTSRYWKGKHAIVNLIPCLSLWSAFDAFLGEVLLAGQDRCIVGKSKSEKIYLKK